MECHVSYFYIEHHPKHWKAWRAMGTSLFCSAGQFGEKPQGWHQLHGGESGPEQDCGLDMAGWGVRGGLGATAWLKDVPQSV